MSVRAFRLRGSSELDAVGRRLGDAVRAWCADWIGADEVDVDVEPVSLIDLGAERRGDLVRWADVCARVAVDDADDWLVMLCGASEQRKMAELLRSQVDPMGHEPGESETAGVLARKAMSDLLDALAAVSGSPASRYREPEEPLVLETVLSHRGGAGLAELSIGGYRFSLAYGGSFCVEENRPRRSVTEAKIVGREAAIGNGVVSARVQLGGSELTIAEVAGLEVGDVIRLDSSVNEPLRIELVPAGQEVAEGFLCACDGSKAIQITT